MVWCYIRVYAHGERVPLIRAGNSHTNQPNQLRFAAQTMCQANAERAQALIVDRVTYMLCQANKYAIKAEQLFVHGFVAVAVDAHLAFCIYARVGLVFRARGDRVRVTSTIEATRCGMQSVESLSGSAYTVHRPH